MERGLSAAAHTKEKGKKRENDVEEDKISQLPDEVLVSILSLLTIDEAGSTSVLSRRWRKVWTFIPSLIWDASETKSYLLDNYGIAPLMIDEEREIYVNWVNQVLESYQGSSIDEFRVIFDLNEAQRGDIDKWVNFAFEKKVRRLVLDFRRYNNTCQFTNVYPFPQLQHSLNMGIPSLIVLELIHVNISQRAIEYFISTCPCLEQITIHGSNSQDLVDLEVAGQSLCLKYLKIISCLHLKSVHLSASNLSSFVYNGGIIEISFANVPNLVEVSVGGAYFHYIICNFPKLSNYVFRLETLTLHFALLEKKRTSLDFTVLTHLKILNIKVFASDDESLLFLAPLIKAAPSLYRIVLLLHWVGPLAMRRRVQTPLKSPHQCLKEVEIVSFVGRKIDMEFASYLIEDAINLEKVIIDPHEPCLIGCPLGDEDLKKIQTRNKRAMKGAMALKSKYSLGDKLVLRNFESSV